MEWSTYLLILVAVFVGGIGIVNVVVYTLSNKSWEVIMASLAQLQAKIDELTQAGIDREARDVAQDAVTQQQIALLQTTITALQEQIANGVAIPDTIVASIQATIDSLNAADPTAPII